MLRATVCDVWTSYIRPCTRIVSHSYWRWSTPAYLRALQHQQPQSAGSRHALPTTGAGQSSVAQSTSHTAAMTSLRAGAMIRLRPDNGRDAEHWRRRQRQRGAASITSTLMVVMALVFITCDTGQPLLHLYWHSQTALPFQIFGRHFNKYKPIPTKSGTHRGLERTFEQGHCRGDSEPKNNPVSADCLL